MINDVWLPKKFELPDGSMIRFLLFSRESWQIYQDNNLNNILVAKSELAKRWEDVGLIDESLFEQITFGTSSYRILSCPQKYALGPVESSKSPNSKVIALTFSVALKESRKILQDASFHDAIYIEQYSRLLPTWTLSPYVTDDVILGTWISGGVVISVKSFRRLSSLVGWMSPSNLAEVVSAAGFQVPSNISILSRQKALPVKRSEGKNDFSEIKTEEMQLSSKDDSIATKKFSLPGRPYLEEFFNDHVIDIIFNPQKYEALGIEFPSAIVLHGPPGSGKTFAVERLVEFIDWPSFSIDSNSVGSPYIHETSKKISDIFHKAIDAAPSVVIIDEMESFVSDRRLGGISSLHHVEEVAEFLRRIPEANKNKVLIIGMTNMIELIDPAILRRGRFDHIIEVGMPSRIEVEILLKSLFSKLPISNNLNMDPAIDVLTGKPLSDIAFVIREAARQAAKAGKMQIDQNSITTALDSLPKDKEKKNKNIGFVWES